MAARLTQAEVIRRAQTVHGRYTYRYSKFIYVNAHTRAIVICKVHGEFEVMPTNHVYGRMGCPKCGHAKAGRGRRKPLSIFVKQAQEIHGEGTYDYSKFEMRGVHTPGIITCKVPGHGEFLLSPVNHVVDRAGCPVCSASKGEIAVAAFLRSLVEPFEREARLIPGRKFAFDFHLPAPRNVLIEYHGVHHYAPTRFGGKSEKRAEQAFVKRQKDDRFKAEWARRNGYRLIAVKFTVKDVAEFLAKKLNEARCQGKESVRIN